MTLSVKACFIALNIKMLRASYITASPERIELILGYLSSSTTDNAMVVSAAHKMAANTKHSVLVS